MSIGCRIKIKRKELNLTQEDVAKVVGVTKQTIQKYENNIITNIPSDKIELLAKALNCSAPEIMGWDESDNFPPKEKKRLKGVKIPVLGYVRAGIPINAVEEILDYEEITEEMARTGTYFCLQIKGDSMEPKFSEGDVVVIRQQPTVENGEIAVVLINGNDATIKKFYRTPAGIKLVATNPAYDPLFYTLQEVNELPLAVIGKVVELRAKF